MFGQLVENTRGQNKILILASGTVLLEGGEVNELEVVEDAAWHVVELYHLVKRPVANAKSTDRNRILRRLADRLSVQFKVVDVAVGDQQQEEELSPTIRLLDLNRLIYHRGKGCRAGKLDHMRGSYISVYQS